jgi:hypothetical protein
MRRGSRRRSRWRGWTGRLIWPGTPGTCSEQRLVISGDEQRQAARGAVDGDEFVELAMGHHPSRGVRTAGQRKRRESNPHCALALTGFRDRMPRQWRLFQCGGCVDRTRAGSGPDHGVASRCLTSRPTLQSMTLRMIGDSEVRGGPWVDHLSQPGRAHPNIWRSTSQLMVSARSPRRRGTQASMTVALDSCGRGATVT